MEQRASGAVITNITYNTLNRNENSVRKRLNTFEGVQVLGYSGRIFSSRSAPMTDTAFGLSRHGFRNLKGVNFNLSAPALYEEAVRRGEGMVANNGPLVVRTG